LTSSGDHRRLTLVLGSWSRLQGEVKGDWVTEWEALRKIKLTRSPTAAVTLGGLNTSPVPPTRICRSHCMQSLSKRKGRGKLRGKDDAR